MPEEIEEWTKKGKVRKASIAPEDEERFRKAREAEPDKIITRPEDTSAGILFSGRQLVEEPSSKGKLSRKDKAWIRADTPLPYGVFSSPARGEYVGDWTESHAYKFDSPEYRKWIKINSRGDLDDEKPPSIPRVFYHITPLTRVKNILRKGLVPGSANVAGAGVRLPGIYVTDDAQEAVEMFLGGFEDQTTREKKFALLEVRPTKDCYVAEDPEFEEFGYAYILYCTIPPSNIKVLRTFTPPRDVESQRSQSELAGEVVKGKKGPQTDEERFEAFLKWQKGSGKKKSSFDSKTTLYDVL